MLPRQVRPKWIEPSGFTMVAALGIEEQRVRAVLAAAPGSAPADVGSRRRSLAVVGR